MIYIADGNVRKYKFNSDSFDNWTVKEEWSRARSEATKFLCLGDKFWIWTTRFAFIFRNGFHLAKIIFRFLDISSFSVTR